MAKFLTGPALTAALHEILTQAEEELTIISPYIRLHEPIRAVLRTHLDNPKLRITVVFGKNEDDLGKSLCQEDLEFFVQFPNIRILYEKRLHAKYYANEISALITSMNLHSYSQNNNIEAGILIELSILDLVIAGKDTVLDSAAHDTFKMVIKSAREVFIRSARFEKTNFGITKKYTHSVIEMDNTATLFKWGPIMKPPAKLQPVGRTTSATPAPVLPVPPRGYCIRTGVPIPFNPSRPMSEEAYRSWSRFSNPDYPEKFCHFSGEPSNSETSFVKPVMRKNWAKAKEIHRLP